MSANDPIAGIRTNSYLAQMSKEKAKTSNVTRILFGVGSLLSFYTIVEGFWTGKFDMHGSDYLWEDHPLGFLIYAAFIAFIGLVAAYVAVFGGHDKNKS